MKKNKLILFIIPLVLCCSPKPKVSEPVKEEQSSLSIRDSIFVSPYGGYGYDIITNGRVIIHQPQIPIVSGNVGFVSIDEAKTTAQLVIDKIKNHQFPPRLSEQDLKNLKITFTK